TRCIGFSYSDVEPMSNEPAGSTTSSGQSAQSRNVSPGLKLRGPSSVAGAVKAVCGAGWTAGGDTGAGAGAAEGAGGAGGGVGGEQAWEREQAAEGEQARSPRRAMSRNKPPQSGTKPPTEPARCWTRGTRRYVPG